MKSIFRSSALRATALLGASLLILSACHYHYGGHYGGHGYGKGYGHGYGHGKHGGGHRRGGHRRSRH